MRPPLESPEQHPGQTSIGSGGGAVPSVEDKDCEWCGFPAYTVIELQRKVGKGSTGTRQFVYACARHEDSAKAAAQAPNNNRKK